MGLGKLEKDAVEHAAELLHEFAQTQRPHAARAGDRYVDTMMTVLQLRLIAEGMPLLNYEPKKEDLPRFIDWVRDEPRKGDTDPKTGRSK